MKKKKVVYCRFCHRLISVYRIDFHEKLFHRKKRRILEGVE